MDLDRPVLGMESKWGGDLDVGGHADAELHRVASSPTEGLFRPQLLIAGRGEGGVQRLGVLPRVVRAACGRGQRERRRVEEIQAPDLGRVDAQLISGDIEDPLDQLGGLRAAGAAMVLVTTVVPWKRTLGMS
jgi:hypothetical protein